MTDVAAMEEALREKLEGSDSEEEFLASLSEGDREYLLYRLVRRGRAIRDMRRLTGWMADGF